MKDKKAKNQTVMNPAAKPAAANNQEFASEFDYQNASKGMTKKQPQKSKS